VPVPSVCRAIESASQAYPVETLSKGAVLVCKRDDGRSLAFLVVVDTYGRWCSHAAATYQVSGTGAYSLSRGARPMLVILHYTPCAARSAVAGHGPASLCRMRQLSKACTTLQVLQHARSPTAQHTAPPLLAKTPTLAARPSLVTLGQRAAQRPSCRGQRALERRLHRRAQAALHLTAAPRARAWCSRPLRASRARAWSRWQLRAWVRWPRPAWLRSPTPRQPPWLQPPPCSPRSRLPARVDDGASACCPAAAGAWLRPAGHPRARAARPRARQARGQQLCGGQGSL